MKKRHFSKGQKFRNWILDSYLGGGGNGEVWKCHNENGDFRAIKLLKSVRPRPYARFLDEMKTLENNSDLRGIIPIIDKYLPIEKSKTVPFYIMPVAENSEKKLRGESLEVKIEAVLEISKTLQELHKRKVYHRDIKPANILYYDSHFSLADFGLVDFPEKRDISIKNEEIGPKWTMAPEMRRESSKADGAMADIYSLAKTMWIFLTENSKGFDGQYLNASILNLNRLYPQVFTTPLDKLLTRCTDNDPKLRLNIDEFINELEHWKILNEDFHERNLEQWFEIQSKLFPTAFPFRVIWENIDDIIKILKVICTYRSLNHMFLPGGGGLDLMDARLSVETGCIELDFQMIYIVKPKRLYFESFNYAPEWNYFRLELDDLAPSGAIEDEEDEESEEIKASFYLKYDYEYVSELTPGNYYPSRILDEKEYYVDEYPINKNSRYVSRWFRGSFVIFCKRSTYNRTPSTYDGRHNKMTTDEFRNYILRSINNLELEDRKLKYQK